MTYLKWADKVGKKHWYDCIFDWFDKIERKLFKYLDNIVFFMLGFFVCLVYVLLQRSH